MERPTRRAKVDAGNKDNDEAEDTADDISEDVASVEAEETADRAPAPERRIVGEKGTEGPRKVENGEKDKQHLPRQRMQLRRTQLDQKPQFHRPSRRSRLLNHRNALRLLSLSRTSSGIVVHPPRFPKQHSQRPDQAHPTQPRPRLGVGVGVRLLRCALAENDCKLKGRLRIWEMHYEGICYAERGVARGKEIGQPLP